MHRIVFCQDGCQILDERDRILFSGSFSECERYLDDRENLSSLTKPSVARERRADARDSLVGNAVVSLTAPLRGLLGR